jgi:hypothetical protein
MVTVWLLVSPVGAAVDVTTEPAGEGNDSATPLTLHICGLVTERLVDNCIAAGTRLSEVLTGTRGSKVMPAPGTKPGLALTWRVPPGRVKTPCPLAPAGSKLVAQEMVLDRKPLSTVVRSKFGSSVVPSATAVATSPGFPVEMQAFAPPLVSATEVTWVPMVPVPVVMIM